MGSSGGDINNGQTTQSPENSLESQDAVPFASNLPALSLSHFNYLNVYHTEYFCWLDTWHQFLSEMTGACTQSEIS